MKTQRSALIRDALAVWMLLAALAAQAAAGVQATAASAAFTEIPATAQTLALLQQGGFVLDLRHGVTDNTKPDRASGVAGSNRLLSAHAPNLMDLIGYFPKEATRVVFRPKEEPHGFEYIASIPPTLWGELLHRDPP